MNAEEAHTLIGAYVLNAVDDGERTVVERHLANCEACAVEVAELGATSAQLGSATAVAPPAALRSRVLAEVHRTRQAPAVPRRTEAAAPAAAPVRRWRIWMAVAVATAMIAVAVGVATSVVQQRRLDTERAQLAQVRTVIAAPDAQVLTQEVAGGGRVSAVVSQQRDQAVVVLNDLPPVDSSQAYQLWTITDGSPASAGVWAAGKNSGIRLVDPLSTAQALAVTREPAGGSAEPTLPILADVPLPE